MKKGKVFFHPIDGSGTLTISWGSEPKGDAIEAKKGDGVGFFSEKGDLLCVIFDEVQSAQDSQTLEFNQDLVKISVKKGLVTYTRTQRNITQTKKRKNARRRRHVKPKA